MPVYDCMAACSMQKNFFVGLNPNSLMQTLLSVYKSVFSPALTSTAEISF